MSKIHCVDCGVEFEPDHHNLLDGLDYEACMCDDCMMEDAEEEEGGE